MAESKYERSELATKKFEVLRDMAKAEGIELKGKDKPKLIKALLEIEDDLDDELEDEELEDEELEEDEIDDEPAPKKGSKKSKKPAAAGETLAAKQVATMLNTEAKTLRQFFRSPASTIEPVGSGGRYEFDKADLPKIKEEFEAWRAGHAARGAKRTGGKAAKAKTEVDAIEEVDEIEELEDEDDLEDEDIDEEDLELEEEDEDE